jgi:hypothetical protein
MGSGSGGGYLAGASLASTGNEKNFSSYGINYANGPVYAQVLSFNDLLGTRATKMGVSYDLGANLYGVKLFANQFNQKNDMVYGTATTVNTTTGAAGTSFTGSSMQAHKATELAATMPYGNFTFMAGRLTTDKNPTAGSTADKLTKTAWGATYALSKRTSLQYYASSTTNAGYAATVNSAYLAGGRSQWAGVQHSF